MDRRSCWSLTLCLLILLIMGFVGYIHLKRELINKLINEVEFSDSAVRDTDNNLQNYDAAMANTQTEMETADKEVKELQGEVEKLNSDKQAKDTEVKTCTDSVGGLNNDIAAVEKDKSDTDAAFAGDKTNWSGVINDLQKQLEEKSPLCAHVLKEKIEKEDDSAVKDILGLCQIQLPSVIGKN